MGLRSPSLVLRVGSYSECVVANRDHPSGAGHHDFHQTIVVLLGEPTPARKKRAAYFKSINRSRTI